MNGMVDVMAGQEPWKDIPVDLNTTHDDYIVVSAGGRPITGNLRRTIKKHLYKQLLLSWVTTQKSWSSFLHPGVWVGSYPQIYDTYANLTCKILTGSFWTGRRAKQWNKDADDRCIECSEAMGEPVEESHQHVLGECLRVIPQLDLL